MGLGGALLPQLIYDETGEYQRTQTEQAAYADKNTVSDFSDTPRYRMNYGRRISVDKNLGYIMNISHMGMNRQFVFMTVYEFMDFMAKRNVILTIKKAYAELKQEFSWPYSDVFAADFGLSSKIWEGNLTLPIGKL